MSNPTAMPSPFEMFFDAHFDALISKAGLTASPTGLQRVSAMALLREPFERFGENASWQWGRMLTSGVDIEPTEDGLLELVATTVFPNDYEWLDYQAYAERRLDEAHDRMLQDRGYHPLTELSSSLARHIVAEELRPIIGHFMGHLKETKPEVFEEGRNGMVPAADYFHRWHAFLMTNGYTLENSRRFVELGMPRSTMDYEMYERKAHDPGRYAYTLKQMP